MIPKKAVIAEFLLAALLLGYGWFTAYRLIVMLILVAYSLWMREVGWAEIGLDRPHSVWRAVLQGLGAALAILVAIRFVIVPIAVSVTGMPVDLSAIEAIRGEPSRFWFLLMQAVTLAAFGEEIVFRGYLIRRIADLARDSRPVLILAVLVSSALFGWAHRYQGPAGMIATAMIGMLVALLFISARNLWPAIVCHAAVDTASLIAIYFGHREWLFR